MWRASRNLKRSDTRCYSVILRLSTASAERRPAMTGAVTWVCMNSGWQVAGVWSWQYQDLTSLSRISYRSKVWFICLYTMLICIAEVAWTKRPGCLHQHTRHWSEMSFYWSMYWRPDMEQTDYPATLLLMVEKFRSESTACWGTVTIADFDEFQLTLIDCQTKWFVVLV